MKKVLFYLLFAALIFTACEKDDDDNGNVLEGNVLGGDLTKSTSLDASVEYTLDGTLAIKDGITLTIPAGTVIKAKKGFSNYVIVERGGKIIAQGTASKPIKFTSAEATPAAGDWGGLVINGKAPVSGATAGTEGSTEVNNNLKYGGTDNADNSGILEYVILEYTGAKSTADVEHNGLTLNAVGNGTKIENIYVPHTSDDGIEFFGGSVNVTNILVINPDDDMFDFTQGYSGTLKNAYGVWKSGYTSAEEDPRGIEADGNLDGNGPTHVGQSNFKVENLTILNSSTFKMTDIIKVRRGATANISNAWVNGGSQLTDVIDLTDSKGNAASATSILYKDASGIANAVKNNGATPAATVTVTDSNTGTDKSLFSWTGAGL
jgi:hypothetical protein